MRWIKVWVKETLYGTTFQELGPAERGIWFSLLLLAASKTNHGLVEAREGVPYPLEVLAFELNTDTDTLKQSLARLQSVGKIERLPNGTISIVNWARYQTTYTRRKEGGNA